MGRFSRTPPNEPADAIQAMYAPPRAVDAPEEEPSHDAGVDPELDARRKRIEAHVAGMDPNVVAAAMVAAYDHARALTDDDKPYARELVKRARTLVWHRASWNIERFTLAEVLCGLVDSEFSHDARAAATRADKEGFVAAEDAHLGTSRPPTPEELVLEKEERERSSADARARLEVLREAFTKARDVVNQVWLNFQLQDIDEPAEMARLSKIDVKQFYLAADRRKRLVRKLLEEAREKKQEEEKP